jgi:hypothetical protein
MPKTKPAGLRAQLVENSRRSYNTLTILVYLLDLISPAHEWRARLISLLRSRSIDVGRMHFPSGWELLPLWDARQR